MITATTEKKAADKQGDSTELMQGASSVSFPTNEAKIREMHEMYIKLAVANENDEEGFKVVHQARMKVKDARVSIESRRKELKKVALEYGRQVDGEAKRLKELLVPVEQHLLGQEAVVNEAKERERKKKAEQEKALQAAKIQSRIDALVEIGIVPVLSVVESLTDDEFKQQYERQKMQFEERRRIEAQEAENRAAQQEQLQKNEEELQRLRQQSDEQQKIIEQRNEEDKKKKRQEESQRIESEMAERRKRQLPDREKLHQYADAIAAIPMPSLSVNSAEAQKSVEMWVGDLVRIVKGIIPA